MPDKKRIHIIVKGRVQGIGYRWFVQKVGKKLNISGWVKNLSNGDVEVEAEGSGNDLESFIASLQNGHQSAQINNISTTTLPFEKSKYSEFEIRFE